MTTKLGVTTRKNLEHVYNERVRQDTIFGAQEHDLEEWYTILGEEVGEVAMAILEQDYDNLKDELIQVAAVCIAMIEDIDDTER